MTALVTSMPNTIKTIGLSGFLLVASLFMAMPAHAQTEYATAPDEVATQAAPSLDMDMTIDQIVGMAPVVVSSSETLAEPVQMAQEPKLSPDIESPATWFNSQPLNMKALKNKVVLIDFWTYSCVNCLRTLPHMKAWYAQYRALGFEIVGVHAPEFDFEKDQANVQKALKRFKIDWPVVMDNDKLLWKRFGAQYWPTHILVDRTGHIIDVKAGEGGYAETEQKIRAALGADNDTPVVRVEGGNETFSKDQTPELYLGTSKRTKAFVTTEKLPKDRAAPFTYSFPADLPLNKWTLEGNWQAFNKMIVTRDSNAAIRLHFRAGKVFVVLGSEDGKPVNVTVTLNGAPIGERAGLDVQQKTGVMTVAENRLYEVANLRDVTEGTLELRADRQGLEAFSFTFGKQ